MSDMNVTSATSTAAAYTDYKTTAADKKEDAKVSEKDKKAGESGAVYEKSEETKAATYNVNKMSKSERADLVAKLKSEQQNRQSQLIDLVHKMMSGQATTFAKSDESMWKFLASGKYTVDAATKAQAQADIAEDGYWGVKQTSQRLFDFAAALAGDDVDKMKEMQSAMEKGFAKAKKTWGGELPGICQDTMKAANKLFDDYYASKKSVQE